MRTMSFVGAFAVIALAACAPAKRSAVNSAPQPSLSIEASSAPFVGSVKSRKFYPRSCHTVKLIATRDQVGFQSVKDAQAAGYARDLNSTDCQ